ncbi:hypothetical protein [Dyella lutea]|uniref:Uncharacterized protein n=1 Tax=Dyella lutea TaxID=2950441 RepID=A0ABT1FG72_9GAMM|nr:hypothetical protein [Dyella lutea]MCP1376346.1 hypothetical protein [Dyella lutea]
MTQAIDPAKLKEAAEHLDWVLRQYPDNDDVQALLQALSPLIEDALQGRVLAPVIRTDIPGTWNFGDGRYMAYRRPSVNGAYSRFITEMGGGFSEDMKDIVRRLDSARGDRTTRGR